MADCFGSKKILFLLFFIWFSRSSVLCMYRDVAAGLDATQSSTIPGMTADLAVDNSPLSCAVTDATYNGTWMVDLGEEKAVSAVYINMGDRYLRDTMVIRVGNNPKQMSICRYLNAQVSTNASVTCYNPMRGRYVKIFNADKAGLKLCQVKVLECEPGFFGLNCAERCRCSGNAVCDPISGRCAVCESGFGGDSCQDECESGTFGSGCSKFCHCRSGEVCDRVMGECSSGCAHHWYGTDCQTMLPELTPSVYKPQTVSVQQHDLQLRWRNWPAYVSPNMELRYRLQYKEVLSQIDTWSLIREFKADLKLETQEVDVNQLRENTYYIFRVVPVLVVNVGNPIEGSPSLPSSSVRTLCGVPVPPEIQHVKKSVDQQAGSAMVVVYWRRLSKADSHCDNIHHYEVWFRAVDDENWSTSIASNNDSHEKITNLHFSTEYKIMVVAYNNRELDSSSDTYHVLTPTAGAATTAPESSGRDMGIVAGVAILLTLILGVIIGLFLYRRRQAKYAALPIKDPEDSALLNNVALRPTAMDKEPSPTEDSGVVEGSTDISPSSLGDPPDLVVREQPPNTPSTPVEHHPIPVNQLERYVMERRSNDSKLLRDEYKEIPEGFQLPHDIGKMPGNKHKNRFINIIPYDHSRVLLDVIEDDPESDYINASYIKGYQGPRVYVAAQGCNKWTIQDMWRLLWVIDSHRIIMVTNLVENGKRKCEQYWPDKKDEEKVYGGIGVTLRSIEQTADFVIRTFDSTKDGVTRNIKQFHFTAWPDHGVPQRASPIISFRRKVRSYDQSHPGTMLVHCSAGVGRTGTFIALDFLQDMAEEEQAIDLFNCTMNMRRDRVNMIQTVEQYLFVYDALLEALKAGKTAIPCSSFRREYDLLYQIEGPQDKSRLQVQFETLATMTAEPREDECCSGKMPDNMEKNRFPEVVASDRHRPYLMTRVHGTNDYINAVFLDGYKSKNEYIVTQMPLPHTVIDLWRMIFEHNVGSVIMINPWDPNNESYGQYWPESGEDCECGPFVIESVATDKPHPDVLVRELRLIYQPQSPSSMTAIEDSKPHTVNQFVLKSWPKDALCPDNKAAIIALINVVEKSQYKTGNGPLIMHCHNGIEASGLMAAISCVWDKMKVDQEVDIFHTVKQLRYHAPLAVQHLEQYDFLYQMVLAYLDEYETYANFR